MDTKSMKNWHKNEVQDIISWLIEDPDTEIQERSFETSLDEGDEYVTGIFHQSPTISPPNNVFVSLSEIVIKTLMVSDAQALVEQDKDIEMVPHLETSLYIPDMRYLGEYDDPADWNTFSDQEKIYMIHHWDEVIFYEMSIKDIKEKS